MNSENYAKSGGDCCPNCESSHINIDGTDIGEAGTLNQMMYCDDCGTTWTEKYQLIGYDDLNVPEKDDEDETEGSEDE